MKLRGKFGVTMLALTFVLASAYIAEAWMGGCMDQQTGHDTDRAIIINQHVNSSGAMRVDEDLYPFHYDDVNQFGDDEAYNSTSGHNSRRVPFPIHREE